MSDTLAWVQTLVASGEVRISDHGYDELAADGIVTEVVIGGVMTAKVVEDYPNAAHGPSVLVLQTDANGKALHILWGIPTGRTGPAVVVTAYRPDPDRWTTDNLRRKTR